MKRFLSLVLVMALFCVSSAFALNYSGSQGNAATFETLGETRVSSPIAVANLETNTTKSYVSHPVLDGYPEDKTFVYRSAEMYGGRASARLNTNLVVFVDKSFADKDAAFQYLTDLGLIAMADEATGSVVLVTPSNPEAGFGSADQKYYYALQTAMLAQKASGRDAEGNAVSYSDAEYFGGYGYFYVIGIDGGATFLNNYVAGTLDYIGRVAGLLLINGKMDRIRQVATFVPTYLVNAPEEVIAKYKAANDVEAYITEGDVVTYYNQAQPLQKVVVTESDDVAAVIHDAYYNMFVKAMRVPVLYRGLVSASTPYQGYNFDEAPYSLFDRNAIFDGKTEDGIYLFRHTEEIFSDIKASNGEYLQTWFEFLPEEVLNNTAPAGSIPLILGNHGSGDDPRLFVDEIGLLEVIGKERIAVVAPEHQYISEIRPTVLPMLAEYMLEKYPSLDPNRVYVMGYSMGGGATLLSAYGKAQLFAAAVPMAIGIQKATDEQLENIKAVDLPIMLITSTYDNANPFNSAEQHIGAGFQAILTAYTEYNDVGTIETFDFDKYPINGFAADRSIVRTVNNEFTNYLWYLNDDAGVPMVALNITEGLVHALYPEYGYMAWDFVKHYSRNTETFEISYNPFVD